MAATSIVLPKSATIVDSKESFGREPIGNVKVTFTDGHAEMWTRLGKCDMAKVSISGLVGWARYEFRGYRNCPILNTLRVCWPDGHHLDFEASGTYPFIEEWNFADDNSAVVIESRAAHGSADYLKYRLSTGEVLGHAHGLFGSGLPVWAQPYSD